MKYTMPENEHWAEGSTLLGCLGANGDSIHVGHWFFDRPSGFRNDVIVCNSPLEPDLSAPLNRAGPHTAAGSDPPRSGGIFVSPVLAHCKERVKRDAVDTANYAYGGGKCGEGNEE